MIQCCQPAAAITVSYKLGLSVQQVQTSEQKHIFHYVLIDWIFKLPIQKSDAWIMLADRKLLASLDVYPLKKFLK